MTDEVTDHDIESSSSHDPPVSKSSAVVSTLGTDGIGLSQNADPLAAPVSSSLTLNCTATTQPTPPLHKGNFYSANIAIIESGMKDLNMSSLPNSKEQRNQEQWQHGYQGNMLQHQVLQQSNSFQVHSAKSQMGSQGVNSTYIGMDQFLHGPSKFSAEVQPVLQSSGFTPPLYPASGGYMTSPNPFYPNLQAPGLYSPQYGMGGYALNSTVVPPFLAGYPTHGSIPMVFDGPASPNFNARMSGSSSGGSTAHGADMQHFNKFYGQLGYAVQPSFTDPLYMQYYQQPYGPAYNISGQFDPLATGGGVIGSQNNASDSKKGSDVAAGGLDDQKFQHQRSGVSNLSQGRGGIMNPHYFGNPPNMGILMQYPSSPLASPVLPASPVGGTGISGGRNEMRFPPGPGRYAAVYPGWQGQRGSESFNDPKIYNFLEELKSGKGRRFELSDIAGHIVEFRQVHIAFSFLFLLHCIGKLNDRLLNFSADQHGSRFIQQKLESCSAEEKASVFKEVLPCASKLMTDVFGNYVIQKVCI